MVDFDARNDALAGKIIDEVLAVVGNLTGGFIKENNTINVIGETWRGEEDVAIATAIVVSIGDLKLVEFLMNAATGFIGGEDAFGVEDQIVGDEFKIIGGLVVVERLELF